MEELLFKLLEQTPTIIILSLGLWDFRNKVTAKEKQNIVERQAYNDAIKELNEAHKVELKELNERVRAHEQQHYVAIDNLTDVLDKFKK